MKLTVLPKRLVLKYSLIFATGLMFYQPTFSQRSAYELSGKWYKAMVMLTSQEELSGEVSLQHEHDLILFRSHADKSVKVFPAYRINMIHFHDNADNTLRKFVSLTTVTEGYRKEFHLYEVVVDGRIPVIRRKKMFFPEPGPYVNYNYFILQENHMIPLSQFKRKVYPEMLAKEEGIEMYVEDRDLNLRNDSDVMRLIAYYNQVVLQGSYAKK